MHTFNVGTPRRRDITIDRCCRVLPCVRKPRLLGALLGPAWISCVYPRNYNTQGKGSGRRAWCRIPPYIAFHGQCGRRWSCKTLRFVITDPTLFCFTFSRGVFSLHSPIEFLYTRRTGLFFLYCLYSFWRYCTYCFCFVSHNDTYDILIVARWGVTYSSSNEWTRRNKPRKLKGITTNSAKTYNTTDQQGGARATGRCDDTNVGGI